MYGFLDLFTKIHLSHRLHMHTVVIIFIPNVKKINKSLTKATNPYELHFFCLHAVFLIRKP